MAHTSHVDIVKKGKEATWEWRAANPNGKLDLSGADLSGVDLSADEFGSMEMDVPDDFFDNEIDWEDFDETLLKGADLSGADLSGANLTGAGLILADLSRANLSGAMLRLAHLHEADLGEANLNDTNLTITGFVGANLSQASLVRANLTWANLGNANLNHADLTQADLSKADLVWAKLKGAKLIDAKLTMANLAQVDLSLADLTRADLELATFTDVTIEQAILTECKIFGASVWGIKGMPKTQNSLLISRWGEPQITVDNIEVAQFIHLLLNNAKIRDVIDTITSKVVLILGRFTAERKPILDALRKSLTEHPNGYIPVIFDFPKPENRDFIETITTLAHLARFVIADFTRAKIVLEEIPPIVRNIAVPVKPILSRGSRREPTTLYNLRRNHRSLLNTFRYTSRAHLLDNLQNEIIVPAEKKFRELKEKDH